MIPDRFDVVFLQTLGGGTETLRTNLTSQDALKEKVKLERMGVGAGGVVVIRPHQPPRPTVVCLCGSTRFYEAFQRANYEETMAGKIVLSVGFYPHSAGQAHGEGVGCTPEQKEALDQLHFRKIDMADEILVLNVGGYVGTSTEREIAYAKAHDKPIRWLEEPHL